MREKKRGYYCNLSSLTNKRRIRIKRLIKRRVERRKANTLGGVFHYGGRSYSQNSVRFPAASFQPSRTGDRQALVITRKTKKKGGALFVQRGAFVETGRFDSPSQADPKAGFFFHFFSFTSLSWAARRLGRSSSRRGVDLSKNASSDQISFIHRT